MAPVGQSDNDAVEKQLKDVLQDLYQMMIQVNNYDTTGRPSKDILDNSVKQLHRALLKVHTTANNPITNLPAIPPELIQYVDNGRNPDIYTRELVEAARKSNQLMKGKMEAFADFRDVLAEKMRDAMPELQEDVERCVEATGGKVVKKQEGKT